MPYLSRRDFAGALDEALFPSEDALLDRLAAPDARALIVTGAGGVGKTRLVRELGILARARGWTVLRVSEDAGPEALEALARALPPSGPPVLLLCGALEVRRGFDELRNALIELEDARGRGVRLLATCPARYWSERLSLLHGAGSSLLRCDLSPESADARAVARRRDEAVVTHILGEGPDARRSFCHGVPAVAALLDWLATCGRTEALRGLLDERDFAGWVQRRLPGLDPAARLLVQMPLSAAGTARLDASARGALEVGVADGWVCPAAEGDGGWECAHDALADEVLLAALRGRDATRDAFLAGLLEAAVVTGAVRSCLRALARVADRVEHAPGAAIPWAAIVDRAIGAKPAAWVPWCAELLDTTLLTALERAELLDRRHALRARAEAEEGATGRLGALCGDLARLGLEAEARGDGWYALLAATARRDGPGNFLLAQALRIAPEALRDLAPDWLANAPLTLQVDSLFVARMNAGLEARDGVEALRERVRAWVGLHPATENAGFLYTSWLDAGGEIAVVREGILAWIEAFGATEDASFVYQRWLDSGGGADPVRDAVFAWIRCHGTTESAEFVFTSWLEAGGGIGAIRGEVLAWIDAFGDTEEARFVYRSWLNAGGEVDAMKAPLLAWIEANGTTRDASFVYRSWLDAGGGVAPVRERCLAWVERHGTIEEAGFVYRGWLDAGGGAPAVRAGVMGWFGAHGTAEAADYVFRGWLEAGGDYAAIEPGVLAWVKAHREKPEAAYLLKAVTQQEHLPPDAIDDVLHWCRHNAANEDAPWRLARLAPHLTTPAPALLAAVEAIQPVLLARAAVPPGALLRHWLGVLDRLVEGGSPRARVAYLGWLRAPWPVFPGRAEIDRDLQSPRLVEPLVEAIESGAWKLREWPKETRRFLRWISRWTPGARAALTPLWARILPEGYAFPPPPSPEEEDDRPGEDDLPG